VLEKGEKNEKFFLSNQQKFLTNFVKTAQSDGVNFVIP